MSKFSVVIPLYNKENFIAKTLSSVLSQSFQDFEIIIVNDASTDKSWSVAQNTPDPRIRYIEHEKNQGLSAARNTGIKAAKSPYVAFLDADDIWKSDYLATIHQLIISYPAASLFASTYELILDNELTVVNDLSFLNFEEHGLIDNFFVANLNQNIYYPSCLTVQKSVFETVGYYDETIQFSEDVDFNIRAHATFRMAFTKKPLVTYVVDSENQITQSPLGDKKIPDYDFYETQFPSRLDIKKYLDFQRYLKAKMYKLSGDHTRFTALKKGITMHNLTWKQRVLLQLPVSLLKLVGQSKRTLLRKGINVNSYGNH